MTFRGLVAFVCGFCFLVFCVCVCCVFGVFVCLVALFQCHGTAHWTMYRFINRSLLGLLTWSFLYQGCRSAMFLVSMKLCGLWRPDRQPGRPFWAKPVLRRVFRTQNWVRRSKQFCRWFWFLLGQAGCGCCLNPVEVSFLLFRCVWWLDCLPLKEGPSAFCSPSVIAWSVSCCWGVDGFSRRWPELSLTLFWAYFGVNSGTLLRYT